MDKIPPLDPHNRVPKQPKMDFSNLYLFLKGSAALRKPLHNSLQIGAQDCLARGYFIHESTSQKG